MLVWTQHFIAKLFDFETRVSADLTQRRTLVNNINTQEDLSAVTQALTLTLWLSDGSHNDSRPNETHR